MSGRSIYIDRMAHSSPIPAAKVVGNMLMSSLITGHDHKTRDMPPDIAQQARNMFAGMEAIMHAAGGTLNDIVKITIWMNNRNDRAAINELWETSFPDATVRPARATLNRELGGGKLIECEIVAVVAR